MWKVSPLSGPFSGSFCVLVTPSVPHVSPTALHWDAYQFVSITVRSMTSLVKKRENNCRGSVEMGTAGPVEFTVTGQGWSVHSVVRMFMVKCVICCISYMQ